MSSNLNLNVQGNVSSPTPTNPTDSAVNTGTQAPAIAKDSLKTADQPAFIQNLQAYVANTSRPLLTKPAAVDIGAQAIKQDAKGEQAAGEQSVATSATVTLQDQPNVDLGVHEPPDKHNQDQSGGGSGGDGQQQDGHEGKGQFTQGISLDQSLKGLSNLIQTGQMPKYSEDEIKTMFSQIGKGVGMNISNTKDAPANAQATPAKDEAPSDPNAPLFNLTVNGAEITGPLGTITVPPPAAPPKTAAEFLGNVYWQMQDISKVTKQMIQSLPAGQDKVVLIDFLRKVTVALEKFQQALYAMNGMTSSQIREKSRAQLETAMKKLEDQWKKQQEMLEKQKEADDKQKTMGDLGLAFAVIGIVMAVVMLPLAMMGPLGLFATSFMVISIASSATQLATKKSLISRAFEALDKLLVHIMDAAGIHGQAQDALKILTKILLVAMVCIVVIVSNPVLFLFGGVSQICEFMTESGVIGEAVGLMGGDKKAQMIATMVTTACVMMVTMIINIALTIAMAFIPGGQAALVAKVADTVAKVAKMITSILMQALMLVFKISEKVASVAIKVLQVIAKMLIDPGMWINLTEMGMQTASATVNYQMHALLADIAKIQGKLEAEVAQADALIQILKKLIQHLLDSLTDIAQFITQTSQLITNNFDNLSDDMSALWSASKG